MSIKAFFLPLLLYIAKIQLILTLIEVCFVNHMPSEECQKEKECREEGSSSGAYLGQWLEV
jgi:hypothetical protein